MTYDEAKSRLNESNYIRRKVWSDDMSIALNPEGNRLVFVSDEGDPDGELYGMAFDDGDLDGPSDEDRAANDWEVIEE